MATAKLTPAMQAALLNDSPGHASLGTVRALRSRGLTYFDGTHEQLTEAGLTARAELREPTGQETRMPLRNASAVGAHLAAALTRPANGTVVTNVADLSKAMRAGLTDRYRVPARTAHALERRGLVEVDPKLRPLPAWLGGHRVTLTPAGERARDALLTELVPGARVRNTMTGFVGTLVRLDHGDDHDMVVLRWDGWTADTGGSPVYLEVITEPDDGSTVVEVLDDDDSTVVDPTALRPGMSITIGTVQHVLGNIALHYYANDDQLTRASAWSLTEGRWLNLLTEQWTIRDAPRED